VDIRRIEGGIFNYRADMDWTTNPFELGLDRLVDLDMDADFTGKEALRRIKQEGVTRRMVGVEIGGDRIEMNETKWPVSIEGDTVGAVTSAIFSPRLEKNIGFAWVPADRAAAGTALAVELPGGRREATVVPMPFVDPGKSIPKS
jgi:aminomethyltransferase